MLKDGLDNGIGQFDQAATDIFVSPLFSLEFCDYLVNEVEIAGPHITFPDQSSDCLLYRLRDGKQLCHDYAQVLRQYVEPAIEEFWTSAAMGRCWGEVPVPFVKKIVNTELDRTVALHNDSRLFTMFTRLNADYKGVGTTFPRQNSCPVGYMALMPGSVTHPHYAGKLVSGQKYTFIGSFAPLVPREDSIDDIHRFYSTNKS
jgi:hypothetical protein